MLVGRRRRLARSEAGRAADLAEDSASDQTGIDFGFCNARPIARYQGSDQEPAQSPRRCEPNLNPNGEARRVNTSVTRE
jgi:hypothetical protein